MTKKFLTPVELRKRFPLDAECASFVKKAQEEAAQILMGQSSKKAVIVGPCSIHSYSSALKYAHRLSLLQKKVESHLFLVMRCFIEKPRTKRDWKGFMYDPHLDDSGNIEEGVLLSRKLLTEISMMQIPIAMEFLDPLAASFFYDLVSWGFIGARTSNSQPHRQLASSLNIPLGIKNSLDGHIENAVYSILASQNPHTFLQVSDNGELVSKQSEGNPFVHLVLRGGRNGPNYDSSSLLHAKKHLIDAGLKPTLVIDCAHDNSGKSIEKQKEVFKQSSLSLACDSAVCALMLESHLLRGSQNFKNRNGDFNENISITDPCLGWEETEALLIDCYQLLSKGISSYEGSSSSSSLLNTGSS